MGRLFVIDLEGPVYKCKHCKIELAVSDDQIAKTVPLSAYPVRYGKLYYFTRCYNVVIGTAEVPLFRSMREVYCIRCGSILGLYYIFKMKFQVKYNQENFYINRFKLEGPPNGSDDENP